MDTPAHLLPLKIVRDGVAHTNRFLSVLPGTTKEMVLDPDYWVHLGSVLKVDDRIEVVAQDGTFDLDLRVVAVDARGYWVQVRLLREWVEKPGQKEAPPKTWPDTEGYRVEWAGPVHKWRIIDRAGMIIAKGHPSEADAIAALEAVKREKVAA